VRVQLAGPEAEEALAALAGAGYTVVKRLEPVVKKKRGARRGG
jgi:hypothetical protein